MWTPFVSGQGVVLKPGRQRQEREEEGQLIRKILLLIRAITQCHNYQCHQLVCNKFFFHPGTDQRPLWVCLCMWVCERMSVVTTCHPITLPDWIYANWTKIKSHLQRDPSWDSFEHTQAGAHTRAHVTLHFFSFNLRLPEELVNISIFIPIRERPVWFAVVDRM